jgi:hypothetical protein
MLADASLQVQTSTSQQAQARQQALPQQLLLLAVPLLAVLLPQLQQQQAQQVSVNAAYQAKQSTLVRQLLTHPCSCSCRFDMRLAASCKYTLTRSWGCY